MKKTIDPFPIRHGKFVVNEGAFKGFALALADPDSRYTGYRAVVEANLSDLKRAKLYVTYFKENGEIEALFEVELCGNVHQLK